MGRYLAWLFAKVKLVKSTTNDLLGDEKAREVEQFFINNPISSCERNVAKSVETIRVNSAQLERDYQDIILIQLQNMEVTRGKVKNCIFHLAN